MRARMVGALMAFAAATFACSDATGPSGIDSYVLMSIDGHPLPANAVVADTFRIVGDMHIVGRTVVLRAADGHTAKIATPTNTLAPSDSLRWDFHCDILDAACSGIYAPTTGTIRGDTLEFVANSWNLQHIYVKR